MVCRVFLGGCVPLAGKATLPEWIFSQGFYFDAKSGRKVRIFGFYNNKQANKKNSERLLTTKYERNIVGIICHALRHRFNIASCCPKGALQDLFYRSFYSRPE
jgi:hypothetical protein